MTVTDASGSVRLTLAGQAAQNKVTNNYLRHSENESRRKAALACDQGDQKACGVRDAWDALDWQRDADLKAACYADGASAACSAHYAMMREVYDSYEGKTDGNFAGDLRAGLAERYTATGERESIKALLNVPHYDAQAIAMAGEAIKSALDFTLDAIPVVGDLKAFFEAQDKFDYALAGVGMLGPVGDTAKALIREAKSLYMAGQAAKASEKLVEAGQTVSRGYYDPQNIRNILETKYGVRKINSTTFPPTNAPNVQLAGQKHPVSEIIFDNRGFPTFDDVAAFDTRLSSNQFRAVGYEQQMQMASRDLWQAIQRGEIPVSRFTPTQLQQIERGSTRIDGFT